MISMEYHILTKVPQALVKGTSHRQRYLSPNPSPNGDTKFQFALYISLTYNSASEERLGP